MSVQLLPTITVKVKETGELAVINATDFDSSQYERIPEVVEDPKSVEAPKPRVRVNAGK